MKLTPILALCSAVLLAGCSGLPTNNRYSAAPLPAPEYKAGELNRESLYELLSAEMAGQRGLFPQALAGYKHQAQLTADAGVAERATRIAQYMRDPDEILDTAQLWIKADPDNAEPYQVAASILLHREDFEQALPLLEQAMQKNQTQTLALIDTRVGQMPENAISAYQQLIERQLVRDPESADLHRSNGVLLRKQDKQEQALAAFDQAQKLAPRQLDILVQKADLLRAADKPAEALKTVNSGLKLYPADRQLLLLATQLQFDAKQNEAGTANALQLIEDYPNEPQLHLYLALLMMDADQAEHAERVLGDLLRTNPVDTTPHFYLGHLAEKRDDREAAIKHFLSVNGGPKLLPAFGRISALLDSAEHQQRMQQISADGRARYPQIRLQLFVFEAEWLHSYDLTETALAVLEEALASYPTDINLLYTRAMLIESTDFPQAEKDLREILKQDPENALALNALGYLISIYTERYEEALELVSKALKLNPDDAATLDSMGWVLYLLQRTQEALPYLQQAYDLLPEPEVTGHLIEVYHALGQTERARTLLEQSLTSNPDSHHLQDVAEKLGF